MREIDYARCSCGGDVETVEPTKEEETVFGCGRPHCCVTALECTKCGVRFTLKLEAPEME